MRSTCWRCTRHASRPSRARVGRDAVRSIGHVAADGDRVWSDTMAVAYERYLVPAVFRPFARDLARRVAGRRPRRMLELAAGTGVLTTELARAMPATEITATDLNGSMVELGRDRAPGAAWRVADAMRLPFDDGQF